MTAPVTAGVAAIRGYLPFGGPRGTTGTLTTTRDFLGHVEDTAAGLVDLGARFYDPDLGRFVSVDPVATPGDPEHLNPYSDAGNNPTSASDPSGLRSGCMCGWATPPPPPPTVPRNAGYEPRRYLPPVPTKAWTRRIMNRAPVDGATVAHHRNARLTFNHGYEYDAVQGGWGERAQYTRQTGGVGWVVAMFFPLRVVVEPALDCATDPSLGNCAGATIDGAATLAAPGVGRAAPYAELPCRSRDDTIVSVRLTRASQIIAIGHARTDAVGVDRADRDVRRLRRRRSHPPTPWRPELWDTRAAVPGHRTPDNRPNAPAVLASCPS